MKLHRDSLMSIFLIIWIDSQLSGPLSPVPSADNRALSVLPATVWFFVPFLTSPRAPMITEAVALFIPHEFLISAPGSLNSNRFFIVFKEVFVSVWIDNYR